MIIETLVPPSHRSPRLLLASAVLASPDWIRWGLRGGHGRPPFLPVTALLGLNIVLTRWCPGLKRRLVRGLARWIINPPVRLLVSCGLLPLGYALLETTGRVSGRRRTTPVGNGLIGDTFWIVAEHGPASGYVRNIACHPGVRVKVRTGLIPRWRDGNAVILPHDDPHARQRMLSRGHPLRALNACVVRVMGTDLLTVRVDLQPNP